MTIGFIGLGNMGSPIAKNLVEAGFKVQAHNRSLEKTKPLRDSGALIFVTAQEAVKEADVVITMLSDDAAVKDVAAKILPVMKVGAVHLSMSTIAPATAAKLQSIHQQHKVSYLASPVMGRPPAAAAKQLFILLSGNASAKEKVQPVLQAVGQRTFDYGDDPSTAHTVKITMNYMVFVITEMLSEVMLVAEKTGVDKQILLETMTSTIFGAPVFKIYGEMIVKEKDNPNGFATQLASKDLRLLQLTAADNKMNLPLADVIQNNFTEMISNGEGQKDLSLLISHLRKKLNH